jgi:hypothetical protein
MSIIPSHANPRDATAQQNRAQYDGLLATLRERLGAVAAGGVPCAVPEDCGASHAPTVKPKPIHPTKAAPIPAPIQRFVAGANVVQENAM